MKNVEPKPSIEICVNFPFDQEELCKKCYKEVCDIYNQIRKDKIETWDYKNVFEDLGVDYCSEGLYFTVEISLRENELIKRVTETILKYKPTC